MDSTLAAPRDENAIAKQRWESFKLGGPGSRPASLSSHPAGHSHKRSHSRNASISSTSSLAPLSLNMSFPQPTKSQPDLSTAGSGAKRNSHHRRRSSVSTRHESAEIMGLSLPELPQSSSEDNINLGEKDSIRRRALWALEGKTDHTFAKVEIPELSTPQLEKKLFDFSSKSSFSTPTSNTHKRDSFKMLSISSSAKDHLHTLVEEEEEEEDSLVSSVSAPTLSNAKAPAGRPKVPRLRPLSLTPDSLMSHGLPTPSRTPSPCTGLKSLTLSSSPSDDELAKPANNRSFTFPPATSRHRSSTGLQCESQSEDGKPIRRSSISYRVSTGLPTPEPTPPAWDRRFSFGSASDDDQASINRPLSASEQHFLVKSHNALLARITDLERNLSTRSLSRSRSRPLSSASDSSSATNQSEPNDEMLQMISDLKAERDELKRDVDGWRQRVAETEGKMNVLAQHVETERREAWVARSRVGLLEVEKSTLQQAYDAKQQDFLVVQGQCHERDDRCQSLERQLRNETSRADEAQAQVVRLQLALAAERQRTTFLEKELEAANLLATPTPQSIEFQIASAMARKKGLGFQSVDSGSSGTIVDDDITDGPSVRQSIKLGSVQEEEDLYEEEDGLAGYEDEHSGDEYLDNSDDGDDFDEEPARIPVHVPQALHARKGSLSTWTFPKSVSSAAQSEEEVDRFFGCFEDADQSPPLTAPLSYENPKDVFARGFNVPSEYTFGDVPESPTFVVPGYGTVLHSVAEEEEEDDFVDSPISMSGITITFTPPESDTSIPLPLSPVVDQVIPTIVLQQPANDEPIAPFSFMPPLTEVAYTEPPSVRAPSPVRSSSPSSIPRRTWSSSPSSPSSIPRKFTSVVSSNTNTSPKIGSRYIPPSNALVTPPSKRVTTSSSIPTSDSPSPTRKTNSPSKIPTPPAFARQPVPKKTNVPLSLRLTNQARA